MKFTDFNLWAYGNCFDHDGGKYDIAYGRDEAMLGGLALGAKGSIGNGFCYAAGVYHRMRKAFYAGDMVTARLEQARSRLVVDTIFSAKYGGNSLASSRVLYEFKNPNVKLGPPRLPIIELTQAQKDGLIQEVKDLGFAAWW